MEKPESLIATLLFKTLTLRSQSWCIITSNFLVAEATGPSSNHTRVTEELNGDETTRIVRPDWTENNECLGFGNTGETDGVVHADGSRSDIE